MFYPVAGFQIPILQLYRDQALALATAFSLANESSPSSSAQTFSHHESAGVVEASEAALLVHAEEAQAQAA